MAWDRFGGADLIKPDLLLYFYLYNYLHLIRGSFIISYLLKYPVCRFFYNAQNLILWYMILQIIVNALTVYSKKKLCTQESWCFKSYRLKVQTWKLEMFNLLISPSWVRDAALMRISVRGNIEERSHRNSLVSLYTD